MNKMREAHSQPPSIRSGLTVADSTNTHDISPEELERLRHEVKSVEHDYFGGSGKGDPFIEYARYCASIERKFSIHERGQYFSWLDKSDMQGRSIKVNHNDAPILARLVVERVPACLPFIELRGCKWDKVFSERAAYVAAQKATA